MAQKVITQLVDDLSDEVNEESKGRTVQFTFNVDNNEIEIEIANDDAMLDLAD